jgi:hypothetical protein
MPSVRRRAFLFVVPSLSLSLSLAACGRPPSPTLSAIERDIFVPRCNTAGCHDVSGRAGSLELTPGVAHGQLVGVAARNIGAVDDGLLRVVPGRADDSFLVRKIEAHVPVAYGVRMPIGSPALTAAEVAHVRAWVDAGAIDD